MMENENDLSVQEAAEYTGLTKGQVEGYVRRGRWNSYLDDKGRRRIPFSEVEGFGTTTYDEQPYDPYNYDPKFDIPKAEIWGDGKAPVIDLPKSKRWVTVMGVSDIHYPYHNMRLIDAVLELAKDLDPDILSIGGDTNDFFALSKYNKAMERLDMLQQELDGGKQIRKTFRERLPNAQIHEIIGNHEERLLTYPGFNAPALRSLTALKPSVLMGLDELEIKLWPMNGFRLTEEFLVEHGSIVRSQSGASARARLDQTLISGVMGHTHRLDSARRSGFRQLEWYEGGCLCMLNPDYVKGEANWKNGFWIGTFSTKTGNFNVQLVGSVGQGFIFDGKHYGNTDIEEDIFVGPRPNFEEDTPSDFNKMVARTW